VQKVVVRPAGVPLPRPGFAPAVKAGPWVFVSGQLATDYSRGLPESVRPNPDLPLHGREHPLILEAEWIFDRLEDVLSAAGSGLDLAVRVDQFPRAREVIDPYHVVRRERVPVPRPASTSVGVSDLLYGACSIEVEMICLAADGGVRKEGVTTDRIPAPLGGYTPAIRAGDLVFVSGQMASDFRTGVPPEAEVNPVFWEGSRIERQAEYTLKNLAITLEAAGSSLEHVVKAQVYLADLGDIPRLDRVWRRYFPTDPPARTILPVTAYGVRDGIIEINVVALVRDGATRKQVVPVDSPVPRFHESAVVRAGDLVFLSGLVAADRGGLIRAARVDPSYLGTAQRREMEYILATADGLLRAAGSSIEHAVKSQAFLTDLHGYGAVAATYDHVWGDRPPAETVVGVPGPLHVPGASVLVDLWAVAG
jgi:reactive intermediate/imine deaminase